MSRVGWLWCLLALSGVALGQGRTRLAGSVPEFSVGGVDPATRTIADYGSIQEAVEAAPEGGAVIRTRPGVYREVVRVEKRGIQLRGVGGDATKVVVVFANGAANTCGTICSATMTVTGDDFLAEGLTIANDRGRTGQPRTQAVALRISGDRAVLRNVRLLGEQDTLWAGSKKCSGVGCRASRQFFQDCYVEGDVDIIFGDAKAVFVGCELHSIAHAGGGFVTAQGGEAVRDSGFVFDRCRLTAEAGAGRVFLGRPWRDEAAVVFLRTEMGAQVDPAGWAEWEPGRTERLGTARFAEFRSYGPGGEGLRREKFSKQLTVEEAAGYEVRAFLRGDDGWEPEKVR